MSDAALELDNVGVRREGRPVLEGISLEINPSTIHVLIGPNGAGKSTLLAALLGQIAFTGTIRRRLPDGATIGYVPQSFVADRTLPITIGEFLALSRQRWPVCLGLRPVARAKTAELLAKVGLAGMERRRLGELSGGELRRVLLANAIEPVPELLILDEPASGMDRASKDRLDEVVKAAAKEHGAAVLMVSHDLERVRKIADRVTWLERAVLRSGAPADVLTREAADG